MNRFLALFLVGLAPSVFGAPTNSEISVSIAVPCSSSTIATLTKNSDTNETRVLSASWSNHFDVLLRNVSDKPQNIWEDDNSWGYDALTFELKDETGKTWAVRKSFVAFHANAPAFWTLKPNDTLVIDVYFANDQKSDWQKWKGFPRNQTVSMRAILENHDDGASRKCSVWTGRAASEWNKYHFDNPTGF
jgi:hypothetical protein